MQFLLKTSEHFFDSTFSSAMPGLPFVNRAQTPSRLFS